MNPRASASHLRFRYLVLTAFLAGLSGLWAMEAAASLPLVNQSPASPCTGLTANTDGTLAFSAHANGTVYVWHTPDMRLAQVIRPGSGSIELLKVHDNGTLAVITRDAETQLYTLQLWDWRSGIMRSSRAVESKVLHGQFMDDGNAFLMSRASADSLERVDTRRGTVIPLPTLNIRGIYDFFLLSGKEDRIMTYSGFSGELSYFSMVDGSVQLALQAEPGLQLFGLYPDGTKRHAVAAKESRVVILDLMTGKTVATSTAGDRLLDMAIRPDLPGISCLSLAGKVLTLQAMELSPEGLVLAPPLQLAVPAAATCLVATGSGQVIGLENGRLLWQSGSNPPVSTQPPQTEAIQSLAFLSGRLVLKTGRQTLLCGLPGLEAAGWNTAAPGNSQLLPPQAIWKKLPAESFDTIIPVSPDQAILGSRQDKGRLWLWHVSQEKSSELPGGQARYPEVGYAANQLYGLESDGSLKLWTNLEKKPVQLNLAGYRSVLPLGPRSLVAGSGTGAKTFSALLWLNPQSGERITFGPFNSQVLDLQPDPLDKDGFYALSLDAGLAPGSTLTVTAWNSRSRTGLEMPVADSADRGALLLADPLGAELLVAHDGVIKSRPFPDKAALPTTTDDIGAAAPLWAEYEASGKRSRQLAIAGSILASCNDDGSVSLWDRLRRTHLGELVVFANGDLVLLERDGSYLPAQSGDSLLPAPLASEEHLVLPLSLENRGLDRLDRKSSLAW